MLPEWCDGNETVTCENGGYPHPRHCWKCVCPGGYGGDRCTERPDTGCGETVEASEDWKTLRDFLGSYSVHQYLENYIKCHYWIQSPEGTEIEVEFLNFTEGHDIDGCPYAGVEIKTNKKQQLTGYRYCFRVKMSKEEYCIIIVGYLNTCFFIAFSDSALRAMQEPNSAPIPIGFL
ncbi:unnamed protein product [Haemonchus placei]|uniref:CUB domain-containing protein n=1 Tax=Haemonchus placei TaxID=6290 RepID=A0A3P7XA95_HAEPC|nr:unnamed protein product [Haemonchus placei]